MSHSWTTMDKQRDATGSAIIGGYRESFTHAQVLGINRSATMNCAINLFHCYGRFLAGALLGALLPPGVPTLHAADPFAENVRTTPWQTPQNEQKSFHLPPGFEIQLFAAEPEILKPMNMAFDAQGRLWVTVTQEYPYPAPTNRPGRDVIKILEDTDGDGRADKITTFSSGLHIP